MQSLGRGDLGFVPTMGALHEGHLALMREARQRHDRVAISIFVNPLQFGAGEDLSRYPRNEERDFGLAEGVGADYVFAPDASEIYPRLSTSIRVPEITNLWEGEFRPGHFDGVATVVAKLFHIVQPKAAYFGWKDLQQCLVIRRMVDDLNFPVELCFLDTVREPDGLALSSRNAYLSDNERKIAPKLYETLRKMYFDICSGQDVSQVLARGRETLDVAGFDVDYLELVSLEDLTPLRSEADAAFLVAARLGKTRLIDNLRMSAPWH